MAFLVSDLSVVFSKVGLLPVNPQPSAVGSSLGSQDFASTVESKFPLGVLWFSWVESHAHVNLQLWPEDCCLIG